MKDHNRTHAADVLQGVYYLTSQPIPGFAQIPTDSTDSPLHKTSIGPLPQSYVKHITVCDETYGIIGANYPALELMALYTSAAMHDFDHPGLSFLAIIMLNSDLKYELAQVEQMHFLWPLMLPRYSQNNDSIEQKTDLLVMNDRRSYITIGLCWRTTMLLLPGAFFFPNQSIIGSDISIGLNSKGLDSL